MLILNFKNYPQSTGINVDRLLEAIKTVVNKYPQASELIYASPTTIDLHYAKSKFPDIQFMAQHVDTHEEPATTGWVPAEILKSIGVEYSLLNHAEHRVWSDTIVEDIKLIQSKGIKLIVPCESLEEAKTLLEANPFGIAFENKDLIGSGKSITQELPQGIIEFVEFCKGKTKLIIGAGVSSGEDIRAGLEMGGEGFVLASAFVKAVDPVAKLEELIKPML